MVVHEKRFGYDRAEQAPFKLFNGCMVEASLDVPFSRIAALQSALRHYNSFGSTCITPPAAPALPSSPHHHTLQTAPD